MRKSEDIHMIKKGIWLGTVTGLLLGIVLWFIEYTTGVKVYSLLLNIDFVPVIGDIEWPIWMEWFFHLTISWAIAIIYLAWIRFQSDGGKNARWSTALLLSVVAALTYFPLTDLAIKETPALDDTVAILYWFIGHIVYAVALVKLDEWT